MVYHPCVNEDEFLNLMLMKIFLDNMDMNEVVHLFRYTKKKSSVFLSFVIYLNEPVYVFEDEQIV
jgi:hypothetical protein